MDKILLIFYIISMFVVAKVILDARLKVTAAAGFIGSFLGLALLLTGSKQLAFLFLFFSVASTVYGIVVMKKNRIGLFELD